MIADNYYVEDKAIFSSKLIDIMLDGIFTAEIVAEFNGQKSIRGNCIFNYFVFNIYYPIVDPSYMFLNIGTDGFITISIY